MARIDDWLTLDPQIPPYAELIKIISRYVDDLFFPLEQLLVLRKTDPKKYVYFTIIIQAIALPNRYLGQNAEYKTVHLFDKRSTPFLTWSANIVEEIYSASTSSWL